LNFLVIPNPVAPSANGGEACLPQAGICFSFLRPALRLM